MFKKTVPGRDGFIVIVLVMQLPYSADMRFILFICISLLVNMFHAATMPVHDVSHMPLDAASVEAQHMDMHHAHVANDDLKSKNHCPDNQSSCCLVLALQPFPMLSLPTLTSQERHIPFSPHYAKRAPVAPFRPPKFYLS